MARWNSQRFLRAGQQAGIKTEILRNAVSISEITVSRPNPGPPILTLGHFSHLTGISVKYLRSIVARDGPDSYREFAIRKRRISGQPIRWRYIAVPEPRLMAAQRWLVEHILRGAECHESSVAYAPNSRVKDAARRHNETSWMIKIDVRDFFESITEIDVYRVFLERGYQPLVALELSRICTRLRDKHRLPDAWRPRRWSSNTEWPSPITPYQQRYMGSLPQGAPTSPMLANLVSRPLDEALCSVARKFKLRYTRYADDLAFSTTDKTFGRPRCIQLIGEAYSILGAHGLSPNTSKTSITPPGGRKVLLGLLAHRNDPNLPREFRRNLRMHLYYINHKNIGPIEHARNRGFSSTEGLRQHLLGLVAFAGQIDPIFGDECKKKLRSAAWP